MKKNIEIRPLRWKYDRLIEENNRLIKENNDLKADLVLSGNAELIEENRRMRELLDKYLKMHANDVDDAHEEDQRKNEQNIGLLNTRRKKEIMPKIAGHTVSMELLVRLVDKYFRQLERDRERKRREYIPKRERGLDPVLRH